MLTLQNPSGECLQSYLFICVFSALSTPSDVLQIKRGGGKFCGRENKTKAKFSFCHYPFSAFSFSFPAPYCDFDKWQYKRRIYVGSWWLAHYHKQNRALSLCHWGAIEGGFERDAWVKTHFCRSEVAVTRPQVNMEILGDSGEDTEHWMRNI